MKLTENQSRIFDELTHEPARCADLARRAGMPRPTANNALWALKQKGLARRTLNDFGWTRA